jgi:hypothetical protein
LLFSNWELAEAHLVLSERGIIAGNLIASTTISNYFQISCQARLTVPVKVSPGSLKAAFSRGNTTIIADRPAVAATSHFVFGRLIAACKIDPGAAMSGKTRDPLARETRNRMYATA